MILSELSDSKILEIAEPILKDTIVGARNNDWALFSKHMPIEDSSSLEIREDVERQWKEDPYLTAFEDNYVFLGVVRKTDGVLVIWRITSSLSEDEYLEQLHLEEEEDGRVIQTGIWTS